MMNTIDKKPSSWNAEDTILVDNITALKAVVKQSGIIFTKGQDTVGDGRHGSFTYDASVARSTANDTTIIDPTDTGSGNGCWLKQVTTGAGYTVIKQELLDAKSYVSQEPATLDTPLQLTFGSAQGNPAIDEVSIDAVGAITFLTGGRYSFQVGMQLARTTGAGTAYLFLGWSLNGTPVGNSVVFKAESSDFSFPYRTSFEYDVPAGAVLTTELIRDSAGVDNGGVYTATPTLVGRPAAYSASTVVSKFVVINS